MIFLLISLLALIQIMILIYFQMESQLSFGADCVIRLEDLGEFKDYSDTLESLRHSLETLKIKNSSQVPNELWQIIGSDPEDTFFLPDFQKTLTAMAGLSWITILDAEQYEKILAFYFRVVEQALISFSFGQQIVDAIFERILQSKKSKIRIQKMILKLLFNLSDKVMYIEDVNKLATLWNIIEEREVFNCFEEKNRDVAAAVYAQCCEKYLRNRDLRKLIQQDENRPFLQLKLSLWQRNKTKFSSFFDKLNSNQYHNSGFLKKACQELQKTIQAL